MKAVVLAAGEGVRLLPLTATRPKHLIRVGGKPILEHCLNALKLNNITEALIITHYMGDAIRHYFGDGSGFGMSLDYVEQKEILGTGNAAGIAEPYIDGDFLLVYGDLLFSMDAISSVLDGFANKSAVAAMAVVQVDKPESYGIVRLGERKQVIGIVEKPSRDSAPSNLANAGLYAFNKDIFKTLKKVKRSIRGEWELTDAITMLAEACDMVFASEISKEDWFDIGRPWDLLEANAWALKKMPNQVLGKVEDGAHLIGSIYAAETSRIRSGAYIEGPAFIDEGADIGPNCYIRPYTSVGKDSRIGNACEVKNSIIMDGSHVGHLSYIGDSVLGEKCNLGAGTKIANLRFDDGPVKMLVKDESVNTGRRKLGAILGDNVKTGIGALLMPGVKIGNDSWIGPGFIVEKDVPAKSIAVLKQESQKIETKKRV